MYCQRVINEATYEAQMGSLNRTYLLTYSMVQNPS